MPQPAPQEDRRHNQLFELLRQKNQADKTVVRAKGYRVRKITDDEMYMLQAAAVKSLQASH